ncbi:SurA N-terminal domain-containing protein [Eleftheria terrae]|uniref:SurA N-terminal domain-containing protein n=1 Tax=Eleftheria terrae TaxID=1597781 RepID=UPI00263B92D2|nr:SurA N-terminal domain-containing protein [Eleftheria terrae]WKB53817.1 SurA N-terminal domain-containing protein [Eleftheria terrae]
MFDFVRDNTRVLFFVLLLLIIPSFVFFGVQGYTQFREGGESVAKVAGHEISAAELDAVHRRQVQQAQAQMPGIDAALLDTPQMRRNTLEQMVRERVIAAAAEKQHLITTDDRLLRLFAQDPQLSQVRKPDNSLNKELLQAQGMNPQAFVESLRQNYSLRQVMQGVSESAMASKAVSDAALDAFMQQREIQVARFEAKDYLAQAKPTDADLQAYYKDPANATQFQSPERAKVEYVVLDLESLKKDVTLQEADLRKYYDENIKRYGTPEERRASHILVKVPEGASPEQRAAAKAKAEQLLAQVKAQPDTFADVAKKNSEDTGSAVNGGDLEFFGPGAMVKPFNDTVFAMKKGEISPLVETEFGYHIIRLTDVRGGQTQAFEAVRPAIEAEVRGQLARQRYDEAAQKFNDIVYEQADSLKPVADQLKLTLQTADNVTRTPQPGAEGPLSNPKLLAALFDAESLRSKRNTDAVEVAPQQLAAARIIEHVPARTLPFEEVKQKVQERVVARQAAELARKDAEAKLAAWQKAPDSAALGAPLNVSRVLPNQQSRQLVEAALKAKADKLPAWTSVDLGNQQGWAVVRINAVAGRAETPGADQLPQQYAQAWAAAESEAYYEALKNRFKTKITYAPKQETSAP